MENKYVPASVRRRQNQNPRPPGEAREERREINSRAAALRDPPRGGPPPPPVVERNSRTDPPQDPPPPPPVVVEVEEKEEENIYVRQIIQTNTFPKFLPPISHDNRETSYHTLESLPIRGAAIWKASKMSEFDVSIICDTNIDDIYLLVNVHIGIPGRRAEDRIVIGSAFLTYGNNIPIKYIKGLEQLGKSYYEYYDTEGEPCKKKGNVLHDVRIPMRWLEIIDYIQRQIMNNRNNLRRVQRENKFKIITNRAESPFLDRTHKIGLTFIRVLKQLENI